MSMGSLWFGVLFHLGEKHNCNDPSVVGELLYVSWSAIVDVDKLHTMGVHSTSRGWGELMYYIYLWPLVLSSKRRFGDKVQARAHSGQCLIGMDRDVTEWWEVFSEITIIMIINKYEIKRVGNLFRIQKIIIFFYVRLCVLILFFFWGIWITGEKAKLSKNKICL